VPMHVRSVMKGPERTQAGVTDEHAWIAAREGLK